MEIVVAPVLINVPPGIPVCTKMIGTKDGGVLFGLFLSIISILCKVTVLPTPIRKPKVDEDSAALEKSKSRAATP